MPIKLHAEMVIAKSDIAKWDTKTNSYLLTAVMKYFG